MAKSLAELDAEFRAKQAAPTPASKRQKPVFVPEEPPPAQESKPSTPSIAEILVEAHFGKTPYFPPEAQNRAPTLAELDEMFRAQRKPETVEAEVVETPPPQKSRSAGHIAHRKFMSKVSDWVFGIAIIVLILSAYLVTKNGPTMIGGYQAAVILSGSMESVYPKDSFILIKEVDPEELLIGNDISFESASYGMPITHRIVDIQESYNDTGERGFVTKGVNNPSVDLEVVRAQDVIGKIIFFVPGLGGFMQALQNRMHFVLIFFFSAITFSLLISVLLGETSRERKIRKAKAVLRDLQE